MLLEKNEVKLLGSTLKTFSLSWFLTIRFQFTNDYLSIQMESDYHSASYEFRQSKNLDTWVYTNSTEVTLNYTYKRFGQLKTKYNGKKIVHLIRFL